MTKKGFGKYSMRHNLSLENKSILQVTPIWCVCLCVTVLVHPKQCIKYSVNYLMATSLSKPVSETELTNPKVDNSGEPGTGNKGLLPMLNTRFSSLDACLLKLIFFQALEWCFKNDALDTSNTH